MYCSLEMSSLATRSGTTVLRPSTRATGTSDVAAGAASRGGAAGADRAGGAAVEESAEEACEAGVMALSGVAGNSPSNFRN